MSILNTNLKWYYSGGASNSDPALSIGGAVSSVELSTTEFHNLFDDVVGDEAFSGRDEYRLLYFVNEDPDVNGLISPVAWVTQQPQSNDTIGIGIAAAGKNATETAPANDHTAPAGVSFSEAVTKAGGTALPSGPYMENDYVGVWFRRHVPAQTASQVGDTCGWAVEGDTI